MYFRTIKLLLLSYTNLINGARLPLNAKTIVTFSDFFELLYFITIVGKTLQAHYCHHVRLIPLPKCLHCSKCSSNLR